jgi:WD40 repeat protein
MHVEICFAPDGRGVLTAGWDGQASLWDWQSGRLASSPGRHSFEICAVAFTRDGRLGLVGGRDHALGTRTARAWKIIRDKPVTPALGAYLSEQSLDLSLRLIHRVLPLHP